VIEVFGVGLVPTASGAAARGEATWIRIGDLEIALRTIDERPTVSAEHLADHDAAVRRLAAAADAFLPARFGQTFRDETALRDAVAARATALAEALARVRGCVQMTLRWLHDPAAIPTEAERLTASPVERSGDDARPAAGGPGTRYLEARLAALEMEGALPEVEGDLAALRPHVRAERLRRGGAPGLLGTAYHLVRRDVLAAYRGVLDALPQPAPLRRQASGPWPNYAFAGALAG
jgi:hypothetical protein